MNPLNISVANLTSSQKFNKELPEYTERYLQGLIDELCKEDTKLTAQEFFEQFRCVLNSCGCLKTTAEQPIKQPIQDVKQPAFKTDAGTIDDTAKKLGVGRTRFFQWLRCEGLLDLNNLPHKEYLDMDYFRMTRGGKRVIVTGKGLQHIKKRGAQGISI
jgi:hypothetical protein